MKYHVRIQSTAAHSQHSEFQPMAEVSFAILVSPANAKEKRPPLLAGKYLTYIVKQVFSV